MSADGEKNVCRHKDEPNKLKVLCLHGYRQNGEMFRKKTGSFRKLVHKYAEFTYITAPHRVLFVSNVTDDGEKEILEQAPEEETYGWFFNRDDNTYRGVRKGGPAIGFESTLSYIEECFEKYGPFDGILGFSQGGCLLGLLCSLQERKLLQKYKFNFAVFVSAFKSNSLPHLKYYSTVINLPTLHIYGENDDIIPTGMSAELKDIFSESNLTTVVHPGGHFLPAGPNQKHEYQKFFKYMFLHKQELLSQVVNEGCN